MSTNADKDSTEISVSLHDVVEFLLRGLLPASVLAIVAGYAAYVVVNQTQPTYLADATVLVARSTGDYAQFGISSVTAPPIDASAYQAAAVSDRVLVDALNALGTSTPTAVDIRSLRRSTTVQVAEDSRDSNLLFVEARGPSPEAAAASANAVANALVAWDRRRASESLSRAATALEEQIAGLDEQIRALQTLGDGETKMQVDGLVRLRAEQQQQLGYARALIASAEGRLSVLQPAGTTPRQVAPRPLVIAVVAATLAFGLVYVSLLLRRSLTLRLRDADDVVRVTGLPVLALFPASPEHENRMRDMTGYLHTSLLSATADAHPRIFLVTSAHEHEGKSMVATKVAEALARHGYRTLLVDADLRAPSVARSYGLSDRSQGGASVEEWLKDPSESIGVVQVHVEGGAVLDVVPQYHASEGAAELLGRGFSAALRIWEQTYDAIVVDTAPVRAVADALAIAPFCTGTVLVADRKKTDRQSIAGAVELLQRVGVRVLGIVLNREVGVSGAPAYGYGYHHEAAAQSRSRRGSASVKVRDHPLDRK